MEPANENRFTEEEKSGFHGQLEDRRKTLTHLERENEEIALKKTSPTETGELSHARLHPADLATDDQDQDIALTLSEQEIAELQAVEAALERLHKGTFGICMECGDDIEKKRLIASPASALCIGCQRELENENLVRRKPNVDREAPSYIPIVDRRRQPIIKQNKQKKTAY